MKEYEIIAVMSSNVDDLLYSYLPEVEEVVNSVLRQFLISKEDCGTFRFLRQAIFSEIKTLESMFR